MARRVKQTDNEKAKYCHCGQIAWYIVATRNRRRYFCYNHREEARKLMAQLNSMSQGKHLRLTEEK